MSADLENKTFSLLKVHENSSHTLFILVINLHWEKKNVGIPHLINVKSTMITEI